MKITLPLSEMNAVDIAPNLFGGARGEIINMVGIFAIFKITVVGVSEIILELVQGHGLG